MSGIDIKISTTGLDDLMDSIRQVQSSIGSVVGGVVAEQGAEFESDLTGITPVSSGTLAASASLDVDESTVTFRNTADYASFVNGGQYASDVDGAFDFRFGEELAAKLDAATADALEQG